MQNSKVLAHFTSDKIRNVCIRSKSELPPKTTSFTQSFRWEFLNKWLLQSKNFPSQDHCFWQESLFPPLLPPPSSSFHCHFLSFFLAFLSLTLLRKEHYFTQNQNNSHKKCTRLFFLKITKKVKHNGKTFCSLSVVIE